MFHVKPWIFPVAGNSIEARGDAPLYDVVGVRLGGL
jgi:hypothetical protein